MIKTLLITGAAKRVGAYIASAMAEAGWNVVIHYHTSVLDAERLTEKITQAKGRVFLVQADMQDYHQVANIFPQLERQGIKVDCLINNASIFEKDSIHTLTQKSWQSHMSVNLLAPMQLIHDFTRFYSGNEGNIINITDGIRGWSISPNFFSYSMSKMGLEHSVKLLAEALAPRIRINAIAPGATLEGLQDRPDTFEKLKRKMPLERASSEEEILQTIQYLLGAASVTGQVISLAGGL